MAIKIQNSTVIDDSRNIINANTVGIGTTSPTSKLTVQGDVSITGVTTTATLNVDGGSIVSGQSLTINSNSNNPSVTSFTLSNQGTTFLSYVYGRLQIHREIGKLGGWGSNADDLQIYGGLSQGPGVLNGGNILLDGGNSSNGGRDGDVVIGNTRGNLRVNTNVGIGTTNPTSKLTVQGDVSIAGVTTTGTLNVGVGGTIITTTGIGSVGIGSAIPGSTLVINAPSGYTGNYLDIQLSGSRRFVVSNTGAINGILIGDQRNGSDAWSSSYQIKADGAWISNQLVLTSPGASWSIAAGTRSTVNTLNPHAISFGGGTLLSGGFSATKSITLATLLGDESLPDLYLRGGTAFPTATVNIKGGDAYVVGGDGASSSVGIASGGNVYIRGGRGYGTGSNGNVVISNNSNLIVTGNIPSISGVTTIAGTAFESYELDDMSLLTDGIENTFIPKLNYEKVTITNPFNLLITVNGVIQSTFINNTDYVFQSNFLGSNNGYTLDSDNNIKFTESVPSGSDIIARVIPSATTPTRIRYYPFKPTDILLGY
jgi:hypothetical protein